MKYSRSIFLFFNIVFNFLPLFSNVTWSEETLKSMTLREKIGQLFIVATTENLAFQEESLIDSFLTCPYKMSHDYIDHLIREYHVGGIIFLFKGYPAQAWSLMNRFTQQSKYPLWFCLDAEYGLSARFYDTIKLPNQMTIGAIDNDQLIYEYGRALGLQCKAMGIHINFSPVADVNNHPKNPIIQTRSFGENEHKVAHCAQLVMQGMHDEGILACAKHFPGHGDVDQDSHETLPTIKHTIQHLHDIEFVPFKKLIRSGLHALMVGHLVIPALENENNMPASLSLKAHDYLRNELNFNGLIFTDGMGMKAISGEPGEPELQALLAANDIILCPCNVPKAVEHIENAIAQGIIREEDIDAHVIKILNAKEKMGLTTHHFIDPNQSHENLKGQIPALENLKENVFKEAITLVKNEQNILPLREENFNTTAIIQVGGYLPSQFEITLRNSGFKNFFSAPNHMEKNLFNFIVNNVHDKDTIIFALFNIQQRSKNKHFGISSRTFKLIKKLKSQNKKIVIIDFGNPYSLSLFKKYDAIIAAYENEDAAQYAAAQVVLGKLQPKGKLPITACTEFSQGIGLNL